MKSLRRNLCLRLKILPYTSLFQVWIWSVNLLTFSSQVLENFQQLATCVKKSGWSIHETKNLKYAGALVSLFRSSRTQRPQWSDEGRGRWIRGNWVCQEVLHTTWSSRSRREPRCHVKLGPLKPISNKLQRSNTISKFSARGRI